MSKTAALVMGIDCSTTSSKAILWDGAGNLVAAGRSDLPLQQEKLAWHEQPAGAWWTATAQAIRQVMAQVDPSRLAALCIAHQRETFVPVDRHGTPLRNGILWMDERARPLLPSLERALGKDSFHAVTGKPLTSNLTVAKIAWLQENEPEIFKASARFLDVQAYLVYRLTGLYRTGWGSADPTGLYDLQHNHWAGQILAFLGLHTDQLPEVFPPGEVVGRVSRAAASVCGLPEGLPVAAGTGDGQAGGLGTNITGAGDAYLSLGTSLVSGTYSDTYTVSPAFRTLSAGLPGAYLLETVLLGGTYTINWLVEKFAGVPGSQPDMASWERAAQDIPPGALGLLLVPYWNTAMSPYWDASASGIVVGWRGSHRLPHFYRAILEGTAFEQRLQTEGVENAIQQPVKRFIAVGGGAQSDVWCQIISDVTGKAVFRAGTTEAASLGAGILAARAAGLFGDIQQAAAHMTRCQAIPFQPDPARHAFYSRLYTEVYRSLFPALQAHLRRLAEIIESGER